MILCEPCADTLIYFEACDFASLVEVGCEACQQKKLVDWALGRNDEN